MAEVKMADPVADQLRQQYPSNSISKPLQPQPKQEEKRKVDPVVKGKAVIQKQTFGQRFKSIFVPGDIKDVKEYAIKQVIIPGIKSGILALTEMILYGEVRRRFDPYRPLDGRTNYSYNYNNYDRSITPRYSYQPQTGPTQRDRSMHDFRGIVYETAQDAEDVISTLLDLIDRDGYATVANYYEASNLQATYTDESWGWRTFQRLEPRRIREGYVIDMQPPILLK